MAEMLCDLGLTVFDPMLLFFQMEDLVMPPCKLFVEISVFLSHGYVTENKIALMVQMNFVVSSSKAFHAVEGQETNIWALTFEKFQILRRWWGKTF